MQEQAPVSGRLCKATAISRVAVFEATWEKYHAGTCFVPGNSKWLGAKSWPEFKFAAGMSTLTQNPDWPVDADGPADYKYDCE